MSHASSSPTTESAPVAHWPLDGDHHNRADADLSCVARGVTFEKRDGHRAAVFNGIDSEIEIVDHPALRFGKDDYTIALWLHTDGGDIVGDLLNKFDHQARRGFNLTVNTHTGVTQTTQSNYRHLQFGIDSAQTDPQWTDCGRPGQAVKISAMASIEGSLYAGTLELERDQCGHLWRYDGEQWHDMGAAPPKCNSVGTITYHQGAIYCGTGRYNPKGSMLGHPKNPNPGGPVYRVEPDGAWVDCGHPGAEGATPDDPDRAHATSGMADETTCLTSFAGDLFAVSHHRRGVWKYLGGKDWELVGPDLRIMSITVHQGALYALINGGGVYRYDGGKDWTYCGDPPRSLQTYCAVTYRGRMHVGTWPECEIIRYEGGESWTNLGRIGYEREVMGAALYNGKCYFGTLPMANVFRMDDDGFTFFGNLDSDPSVCLRRVWTMCVHDGYLYGGTLPQGKLMRRQAGRVATHDHALKPGWRHIVAARRGDRLQLYVDGERVAESRTFDANHYDLDNNEPLRIGAGVGHVLRGALRDVRLYRGALDESQINATCKSTS